jgi:predicted lipid-binding transport protein (Tim44 family)
VLPPPRRGTVAPAAPAALAAGIARIKSADPKFDEAAFLKGARAAFEIVINAFAKGDVATLKTLLSEAVYASFAEAIRARAAQHETLETTLLTIKSVQLVEAELEDDTVLVTVRFVSDQTNVTRAADGSIVEGNPEEVVEKTDLWTFSRSVRSRDPNWVLVATTSA